MMRLFPRIKIARVFGLALGLALLASPALAAPLSPKDRVKTFEQVWRLIRDRYYDPAFHGLDWNGIHERYRPRALKAGNDDELYAVLKQMTGELRDAHTRFRTPGERQRASRRLASSPGVQIGNVEGAPTVVSVEPGSDAARSGVEAGMVVAAVDGQGVDQRLSQIREQLGTSSSDRATLLMSYYRLLSGEPASSVRISFLRSDGTPLEVVLKRHLVSMDPPVSSRMLNSGVLYLRVRMFDKASSKQARAELNRHRNAAGLILDLRGNPGGNFAGVLDLAESFFGERVQFGKVVARSGEQPSFMLRIFGVPGTLQTGHAGRQIYSGPVVILVNEGSGSAAELFAAGMQENGRARVIGRQSCGCVLGTVPHKIKGGGELDISEFAIVTGKGQKLEGTGVIPDVAVPLTLTDLRQHRDAALQRAEAVIESRTESRK
jgi:carboxyl-terminal processing protease